MTNLFNDKDYALKWKTIHQKVVKLDILIQIQADIIIDADLKGLNISVIKISQGKIQELRQTQGPYTRFLLDMCDAQDLAYLGQDYSKYTWMWKGN